MHRKRTTPALALGALGLGAALASCYSPSLISGFDCDPANVEPRCPDGFTCNLPDQKCYRPGELPGVGNDGGSPGDGGMVLVDAGPNRAQPMRVSDGRRVALATSNNGARVAFEDPPNTASPTTAQIRAVDLDNDGTVLGNPFGLSNVTLKARDRVQGEGDQIAAFGWIEYDTDITRQELWIHAGGGAGAQQISQQVVLGKGFPFDIVVRANRAYAVFTDTAGTRLVARRVDGTPGAATMLTLATMGSTIDELDAAVASDGDGLVVIWHEVGPGTTGGSSREDIRVARFATSNFAPVWSMSLDTLTNSQRGTLRRPRVSVSSVAASVGMAWENGTSTVVRGVPYTGGAPVVAPSEADFAQPVVVIVPQLSGGMTSASQSFLFGTHRASASDDRGALLRRRIPIFTVPLPDLGSRVAALAVVGDADHAYIAGQDGTANSGNVFAWSSAPGWAPEGLRVNVNTDAVRPEVVVARRTGGGIHVAWVENGANEGQVFVQSLKADSTTTR